MKKVLIVLTTMFALLSSPLMAEPDSLFGMKMKDAGFRWTQDADDINNFWSGSQDGNSLRLFTSAYVGNAKKHEVTLMYNRGNMSGPWDLFEGTSQHIENVAMEYRYNFDK